MLLYVAFIKNSKSDFEPHILLHKSCKLKFSKWFPLLTPIMLKKTWSTRGSLQVRYQALLQGGRVSLSASRKGFSFPKEYNIYIFKYGGTINEDNADHLFSNMDFFYWIVGLLWAKAINVKATFYQELALPVAFVDLGGSPAPLLVIIRTRKNHEIWQLLYQSCYRFPKDR